MAFDLTVKDVDAFSLEILPVLLDLFQKQDGHSEEDYAGMLRGLLECCADNLGEYSESLPQVRQDFREAVCKALWACSQQIGAARKEWDETVKESTKD